MVLANIISAFGLAGAAGLNAYIPLLIVAVLGKVGVLQLREPFDVLTSWPVIIALVVLFVVEFAVDKAPGADSVNDAIQTFVRPAAGAILFAANTGVVEPLNPTIALIAGLLLAFSVHATKAVVRPVANAGTMGVAAPILSVAEDVTSAVASFLAIFFPLLFVLFAMILGYVVYRLVRRVRNLRKPRSQAQAPATT
jgi:hypothetical protein